MTTLLPRAAVSADFPDPLHHFACPECHRVEPISLVPFRISTAPSSMCCPECSKPIRIWFRPGGLSAQTRAVVGGVDVFGVSVTKRGRLVPVVEW